MRYRELLTEEISWVLPDFEEEYGEVSHAFDATGTRYHRHFPDKETWFAKAKQGSMQEARPEWNVENTDAFEGTPFDRFDQDKIERVKGLFDRGAKIQLPVILHDKKGYILIGGNTRLSMAVATGEKPMAWVISESAVGKIVQGVNTTVDVKVGQDKIEQKKFFDPKFYKGNNAV